MKTRNKLMASALVLGLGVVGGCGVLGPGPGGPDGGNRPDGGSPDGGGTAAKFSSLYTTYLNKCKDCHAPGAPGRTNETERTLDFSTQAKAHQTLTTGKAMGLVGNQMACNGAAFVVSGKPADSLLVAVLDEGVRQSFSAPGAAMCDKDAVSDMTLRVGEAPSAAFLMALKEWIQNGAPNN